MQSHFALLTLFAFFVSLVFAVIAKDDRREQLRFGGLMFAGKVPWPAPVPAPGTSNVVMVPSLVRT